jgi:mRNA interferase YafQ
MLIVKPSRRFEKDVRRLKAQNKDLNLLENIVLNLAQENTLEKKHKDHKLKGEWKDFRECHIGPDWLLIYKINENIFVLTLVRTGSHDELFG